jgi:hypothetical protein
VRPYRTVVIAHRVVPASLELNVPTPQLVNISSLIRRPASASACSRLSKPAARARPGPALDAHVPMEINDGVPIDDEAIAPKQRHHRRQIFMDPVRAK